MDGLRLQLEVSTQQARAAEEQIQHVSNPRACDDNHNSVPINAQIASRCLGNWYQSKKLQSKHVFGCSLPGMAFFYGCLRM